MPDTDRDQLSSEALARRLAAVADAKQAEDVVALDMRRLVSYTDFLVICTARNERLAKAIHEEVHQRLKQDYGVLPATVEGERTAHWVLMDYLDCVLHVFVPELRERYRLDVLWGEAPRLELEAETGASGRAASADRLGGAVRQAP
ncbi:MAG TPA: ribosome silencing factor [Solirubrobacterales bacterium]|nr:ribosome silencing factor [Solirubrobacterales bacterium]